MDPSTLWQRLLDTVQNPAADPRSTVFLIGIAFVFLLAIVLVVFILLPEEEEEQLDEWGYPTPSAPAPKHLSTTLLVVSLLMVGLVLAGFVYGDWRSRQDSTCRSCHVLQPLVETRDASTHPDVECITCHESPGALGGAETRVRALSDLLHNLTTAPVTLSSPATVNQENCISCHQKELSGVLTVGRQRVRHSDFVDDVPCSQCHGQVGHDPTGQKTNALSSYGIMTTCTDCHDGTTAPRDCETCHVGDIAYAGTGPKDFARIELGAPTTCKGCHPLDSCETCHGIVMPHPPGWKDPKMHAPTGAFDTTVCVRCHDAGCPPCHGGIHTSHPPDWKTGHQTGDSQICTRSCHDPNKVGADMCHLCHASR